MRTDYMDERNIDHKAAWMIKHFFHYFRASQPNEDTFKAHFVRCRTWMFRQNSRHSYAAFCYIVQTTLSDVENNNNHNSHRRLSHFFRRFSRNFEEERFKVHDLSPLVARSAERECKDEKKKLHTKLLLKVKITTDIVSLLTRAHIRAISQP